MTADFIHELSLTWTKILFGFLQLLYIHVNVIDRPGIIATWLNQTEYAIIHFIIWYDRNGHIANELQQQIESTPSSSSHELITN